MSNCQTQIKILLGCERLTPTQSLFKLVPIDLETRIAHRPKDKVTLGFVGNKPNLTGRERLAPQSKNLFSDCEKDKKLV